MDLSQLTIKKIRQGLENKEFSSVDLTKEYLKQIEMRDKSIGAFLSVEKDYALDVAKNKKVSPLSGVPCAIKDNIMVEGLKCTAASKILENYIAPYDATVIKKLKEAGAIILGKTNLDEFAMGASTENSGLKMTRNPVDLDRVPGGSSGGSAAAVASGQCCFALGSDTGGSIRQPASFCGLVGFKPSYGAVSRYGLIAFASSLDQIGPITKNVEDAKIVFDIIRGKDKMDSTSVNLDNIENCKFNLPAGKAGIENLRVGVPKEYFIDGMDKEVEKSVRDAIKKIEKQGAKIKEISLPHTEYAVACYYIIAPAEASANLARFDGIKYGLSENKNGNLLDVYLQTRGKGFGAEVKRRIMLGTYSLSSGYYDAYYKKAQQVRNLIKEDFDKVFEKVDIILTPTTPTPAFKIGEKADDPLSMYLADIFTVSANLAGLPALSLPCGKANGLPIGLQIIGKQFDDYKVLDAASLIEKILQ